MSNEAVNVVVALQIKAWYKKGLSCLPREGYAVRAYIWLMAKSIKGRSSLSYSNEQAPGMM